MFRHLLYPVWSGHVEGPGHGLEASGGLAHHAEDVLVCVTDVCRPRSPQHDQRRFVVHGMVHEMREQVAPARDVVRLRQAEFVVDRQGRPGLHSPLAYEDQPQAAADQRPGLERHGAELAQHVVSQGGLAGFGKRGFRLGGHWVAESVHNPESRTGH
jgi:hypothetical protein